MTKKTGINMDDLYRFYNDIYSKLPFSIKGYNNLEGQINRFFNDFMGSSLFKAKDNIKFLSYSYAKLKNIDTWEVERFSESFFWHAVNETFSDIILSFYFYAAQKVLVDQKNEEGKGVLTATILADLFVADCSFRLKYTKSKNWKFRYIQNKDVFSVKVPLLRFFKVEKDNDPLKTVRKRLRKFIHLIINAHEEKNECLLIAKGTSKHNNVFSKTSFNDINKFEKETRCGCIHHAFFNDLFIEYEERDEIVDNLTDAIEQFHKSHSGFFNTKNTQQHIKDWVKFFFPVCFISIAYDCWIEYMPAVCGYSAISDECRNLGGILVGYDPENELSKSERTIFKMTSEKISSAIAVNKMHDFLEINLIRQASECFEIGGVAELTHPGGKKFPKERALTYALKQSENFKSQIIRYQNNVGTSEYLNSYLSQINEFKELINKNKTTVIADRRKVNFQIDQDDIFKYLKIINSSQEQIEEIDIVGIEVFRGAHFNINPVFLLRSGFSAMIRAIKKHNNTEKIYVNVFNGEDCDEITFAGYDNIKEYDSYIVLFHAIDSKINKPSAKDNPWTWMKGFDSNSKTGIINTTIDDFYAIISQKGEKVCYNSESEIIERNWSDIYNTDRIIKKEKKDVLRNLLQNNHAIYLLKTKTLKQ